MRRAGQPQPVTLPKIVGEDRARIRRLEFRRSRGAGARVVYGAVYNDGTVIDTGSGDWSVAWDSSHTYTITIDPPLGTLPISEGLTATNNNPSGSGDGRYTVSVLSREPDGSEVVVITQDADDPGSLTDQDGSFDFAFRAGSGVDS